MCNVLVQPWDLPYSANNSPNYVLQQTNLAADLVVCYYELAQPHLLLCATATSLNNSSSNSL